MRVFPPAVLACFASRSLVLATVTAAALLSGGCFRSRMLSPHKSCPADDPNCNTGSGARDAAADGKRDAIADGKRDGAGGTLADGAREGDAAGGRDGKRDGVGGGEPAGDARRDSNGDGPRDGGAGGKRDARSDGIGDGKRDACGPIELCGNGIDDDCNGFADCFDKACMSDPACIDRKKETCDNGIDDDGNGFADCEDPACFGDKACTVPGKEICNNNLDDDGDGQIDCEDPDCVADPICAPVPGAEICDNGKDDNGDGLVDCTDPQCKTFPACLLAACVPDVDFGAIAPSGASVTRAMATTDATASFATCAPPGGVARVGGFSLAVATDVRLDFSQGTGAAHVVALFQAGVGQACDANPVDCLNVKDKTTATHGYVGLAPGSYWVVVQSYPGTAGAATVTLSTGQPGTAEICNNGIDDDGDGAMDCADLDCATAPSCNLCLPDITLGTIVVGGEAKSANIDTTKGQNRYHPDCAGLSDGNDVVVKFSTKETLNLNLDIWQYSGDHAYALFYWPEPGKACDSRRGGCNDLNGEYHARYNWKTFAPGDYVLIFKALAAGEEGSLSLTLTAYPTRGVEICDNNVDDDGDQLVDCADPDCYNLPRCAAPLCMPDEDLGDIDVGTRVSVAVDLTTATKVYRSECGKGDGRGRAYRVNLLAPMTLEFRCTQTGDHVIEISTQTGPLDACDAHITNCSDPINDPGGCNFGFPSLQPGVHYVLISAFASGDEGTMSLTLRGVAEDAPEICNNGIDDDQDGAIDCDDRKCTTDETCRSLRCRPDKNLGLLPLDGSSSAVAVQTSGAGDDQSKSCTSGMGGEDSVVSFELPGDTDLTIDWAQVGDHVFALYEADTVALPCEANIPVDCTATKGTAMGSYRRSLPAGKYYLVVDADRAGSEGGVILQIGGTLAATP
ncbi:MAG: hypothetical protein JXP73_13890 [Deltaproteobacteria bacterium]|nr:hypothetical protein [Deltaproteobacteria bacterium]